VVHALYLCNLATPNDEVYDKSVTTLRTTIDAASAIEADAVIFHAGSHLGAGFEAGLDRTCAALEKILERCEGDTWLCLENSAGAGGTIGRSLEELGAIFARVGHHPRLGICLDSCHLYASGYDVTDPAAVEALVQQLDREIGLHRLRALHVNDSAMPLGSNRDRHANIGEGLIGEGLGTFLAQPEFQHLSAYLEVAGADGHGPGVADLDAVRSMHRRGVARRRRREKKEAASRGR
jgi:deoxyribonuclease-4